MIRGSLYKWGWSTSNQTFLKDHIREAIDAIAQQAMKVDSEIGGGAKPSAFTGKRHQLLRKCDNHSGVKFDALGGRDRRGQLQKQLVLILHGQHRVISLRLRRRGPVRSPFKESVADDGWRYPHDHFTLFIPANMQVTCKGFSR